VIDSGWISIVDSKSENLIPLFDISVIRIVSYSSDSHDVEVSMKNGVTLGFQFDGNDSKEKSSAAYKELTDGVLGL